jgi:hypothetical protein
MTAPKSAQSATRPATSRRGGGGRVGILATSDAAEPNVAELATDGTEPKDGEDARDALTGAWAAQSFESTAMSTSSGVGPTPDDESVSRGCKMLRTRRRSADA